MPQKKPKKEAETPRKGHAWITVRTTQDMVTRVDAAAAQLGIDRSELVRIFIETGLGEDAGNAVVKQAVFRLSGVIRRAVRVLVADLAKELPDQIIRELEAADVGRDGSGRAALHGTESTDPDDTDAEDDHEDA